MSHDPGYTRARLAAMGDAALLDHCVMVIDAGRYAADAQLVRMTRQEAWYECCNRGKPEIYDTALAVVETRVAEERRRQVEACESVGRK
jgi:hypothetical protein